jgi:hypothetical protein
VDRGQCLVQLFLHNGNLRACRLRLILHPAPVDGQRRRVGGGGPGKYSLDTPRLTVLEDLGARAASPRAAFPATLEPVSRIIESCSRPTVLSDEDVTTSDTTTPSIEVQGPIMRSRAQQLRRQVNSFLYSSTNDLENRLLPNDLIVIRNQGVDHRGHVGHQEGARDPRRHA